MSSKTTALALETSPLIERVIQSYRPDGPFMVLRAPELDAIYKKHRLDPTTTDPSLFAVESLAHVLQGGMTDLFGSLNLNRESAVLSVGEGNGAPSRLLAKLVGCRVVGVDVVARLVELRNAPALPGIQSPNGSFA